MEVPATVIKLSVDLQPVENSRLIHTISMPSSNELWNQ